MLPSPDLRQIYAALRQKIHLSSCPNFPGQLSYAASAILRYHWQQTGSLDMAVAYYHAGPKGAPAEMAKYLSRYHQILDSSFGGRTR